MPLKVVVKPASRHSWSDCYCYSFPHVCCSWCIVLLLSLPGTPSYPHFILLHHINPSVVSPPLYGFYISWSSTRLWGGGWLHEFMKPSSLTAFKLIAYDILMPLHYSYYFISYTFSFSSISIHHITLSRMRGRVTTEKTFLFLVCLLYSSVHTHLVKVNNQCSCRAQQFASTQPLIIC